MALDPQGQLGQGANLGAADHLQAELRSRQIDAAVTTVLAADDLEVLTTEVEVDQAEVVAPHHVAVGLDLAADDDLALARERLR